MVGRGMRGLISAGMLCMLYLGSVNSQAWFLDKTSLAVTSSAFAGTHYGFNQHDYDLTRSVTVGAHIAIAECQRLFRFHEWSCPEGAFKSADAQRQTPHQPNIGEGEEPNGRRRPQGQRKQKRKAKRIKRLMLKSGQLRGKRGALDEARRNQTGSRSRALNEVPYPVNDEANLRTWRWRWSRQRANNAEENNSEGVRHRAESDATALNQHRRRRPSPSPAATAAAATASIPRPKRLHDSNNRRRNKEESLRDASAAAATPLMAPAAAGQGENGLLNWPPSQTKKQHNYHNTRIPGQNHRDDDDDGKVGDAALVTREQAFVHAITSAGIAHTLTKNCSTGDFGDCGCDTKLTRRKDGWKWGGCSDNYHFGSQVSQRFLDTLEQEDSPVSLANLHNNEAGRIAVRKTMRRLCKCHGVSGSCALQTCWKTLADFKEVGDYLVKMYKQGLKVEYAEQARASSKFDRAVAVGEEEQLPSLNGVVASRRTASSRIIDYGSNTVRFVDSAAQTNSREPDLGEDEAKAQRSARSYQKEQQRRLKLQRGERVLSNSRRRRVGRDAKDFQRTFLSQGPTPTLSTEEAGPNGMIVLQRKLSRVVRFGSSTSEPRADGLEGQVFLHTQADRKGAVPKTYLRPLDPKQEVKKRKLVFLQESADYCLGDPKQNLPPVLGRTCTSSSETGVKASVNGTVLDTASDPEDIKQCSRMCRRCGLRPQRRVVAVMQSCNCRFHWCCHVTCETCRVERVEISCVA